MCNLDPKALELGDLGWLCGWVFTASPAKWGDDADGAELLATMQLDPVRRGLGAP